MHVTNHGRCSAPAWKSIPQIRTVGADAEPGTVNGMLPDFRFVLGAILALAMLAVGGLGLVTSVQLAREAHIAPLEESRSLAFAGRAERNQFYDPDAARRLEGLGGKVEVPAAPVAPARLEPPAEALAPAETVVPQTAPQVIVPPAITPPAPDERTAAIPAQQPKVLVVPETIPLDADDRAPEKAPEPDPPTPPETAGPPPIAALPAETSAPNDERVASLPVPAPGPDRVEEARAPAPQPAPAQPQASAAQAPDSAPPAPRARPKIHIHKKLVRARIRRIPPVAQQPPENSGFPSPWPDNQFTGTTTRIGGKLTGVPTNRPQ
jgi:hypothetical protein